MLHANALEVAMHEMRPFSFRNTRIQMFWDRMGYVWDKRTMRYMEGAK